MAVKFVAVVAALLAVAAFVPSEAQATEGGGGAYAGGGQGFLAGMLPPPGFYFIEYAQHYSANKVVDEDGDRIPIQFKLNVSAAVERFLWQSDIPVLGGHLGAYTLIPLVHASAETALGNGSKSGLGDIVIAPFISWHFNKNFHMASSFDIVMPTGSYDKTEAVNLGRNYWTFEPVLALTYITDGGTEFSGKFMYDINTENDDTDYKSGQEFHVDYAIGQHFGQWTAGLVGYIYKQTTGDSGAGAVGGGNQGQIFSAGPGLRYDAKNGVSIEARYNKEFEAENKPEGDRFWFNVFAKF
jgi:hypothetical protein